MITMPACVRLGVVYGVSPEVIENDYLVEMVLREISCSISLKDKLIFRGGTCLHKVYFDSYRFSEDIDFVSVPGCDLSALIRETEGVISCIRAAGASLSVSGAERERERAQIFLSYDIVPEIRKNQKKLKIDLCITDEMPAYKTLPLKFIHDDFKEGAFTIKACIPEAVAADKMSRTMGINKEARDLYDIKHLFKAGLDLQLVRSEFKKSNSYDIDPEVLIQNIKGNDMKKMWENRLKHQVRNLPKFEEFTDELSEVIRRFFKKG